MRRKLVHFCIAILFTTLGSSVSVVAACAAGISVSVDTQAVTLRMILDVEENYGALPRIHVVLDSSNSTSFLGRVQTAVQEKIPTARVESLVAGIGTRLLDNSTKTWVFEENYTFGLTGVSKSLGGQVAVNTAFLSMNISDPISVGGVEINKVGAAYLLQPLLSLPTTSSTRWLVSGSIFLNTVIPGDTTRGFDLLDFSWVPSLASWYHSYSVLEDSTWNLTPSSPFNVTVAAQTPEGILVPKYSATYSPTLELTAPPRARFENGMIFYDLPGPADIIMPGIVAASLVVGVASFILDRRLTAVFRVRRKKR